MTVAVWSTKNDRAIKQHTDLSGNRRHNQALGQARSGDGLADAKADLSAVRQSEFCCYHHPFSDDSKRIAAASPSTSWGCGCLYRPDGGKRLAGNALVALTLLIAGSRPEEKDAIVKIVVNLISRGN